MERIVIEGIYDIADLMYNKVVDTGKDVTFAGLYEDVAQVMKDLLMSYDETKVCYAELEPVDLQFYNKEYLISLDTEFNIWCQKAYQDEYSRYVAIEDNCVFVADDCDPKILEYIDASEVYEMSYNAKKEECNEPCTESTQNSLEIITRVATDNNGKMQGFEKSWETHEDGMNYHSTYSFYSNNEELLKLMLEQFENKH